MTLESLYIFCRWLHFSALMLLSGSAFYSALLAPRRYRPLLSRRLMPVLVVSTLLALLSAVSMLALQTGLMSGDGRNIVQPAIWRAVLHTGFGGRRIQLLFALLACLSPAMRGVWRQRLLLLCGWLSSAVWLWWGTPRC